MAAAPPTPPGQIGVAAMHNPSQRGRSRVRRRLITTGVAVVVAISSAIAAGAPAAMADPVVVAHDSGPDWDVTLTRTTGGVLEATIANRAATTRSFGLGATTASATVVEPLWRSSVPGFAQATRSDQDSGATQQYVVPLRAGTRYVVYRDVDATTPEALVSYTTPGRFAPFTVSGTDERPVFQFGNPITLTPAVVRAGEAPRISVGGLGVATSAEVWLVADQQAQDTLAFEGDAPLAPQSTGGTLLGTLPVTGGRIDGTVAIPGGRAPGEYALLVGDSADQWWPGGPALRFGPDTNGDGSDQTTFSNLRIESGAPRGATPASTGPVEVRPLDQNGNQPVTFTFAGGVATAGTTTVSTATTGPSPTGFSTLAGAPSFYTLETTATFSGPVTVCITFPTVGLSAADASNQSLFHFVDGIWVDITQTQEAGRVCGETTSFSPFAVGKKLKGWSFTGFFAPVANDRVNVEFAGSIVPFRFRLGGDRGLKVLAAGSPSSGTLSRCTVAATPASSSATASALPVPLVYVRASGTYWYLWNTDRSWAGTCRQFILTLADGTTHRAAFKFVKPGPGSILRALTTPS